MTSQFEPTVDVGEDLMSAPVVLTRTEFNELRGMIAGALKITAVRMADGSITQRMCTACEMYPIISHQVGNVTCGCVCHRMRELVGKYEAM